MALCACEKPAAQETHELDDSLQSVLPAAVPISQIEISPMDESPIVGRWEVVDYHITPVAAIDESEATEWLGLLVVYSENAVGFESELCETPSFEEHAELFDDYFADYEIDPAVFDIEEPEINVISIQCGGFTWTGPGSELIHVKGDTIVIVFDGVFMSMETY